MPKREDIHNVMIIGSGPIVIGQACEFDYSGAQACKALSEEGCRVILVNSNPATIMTDPNMADATYIEPIEFNHLKRIIEIEKPDAILPTMGGQTALNVALELDDNGVLQAHNITMIGASKAAINKAEDREQFRLAMHKIGLGTPLSRAVHNLEQAQAAQNEVGFPVVVRPSFTLGGSGSGIAYNRDEFVEIVQRGLETSPSHEVLIEQSVLGWKEYEMEVVRDSQDNCIIVCAIENLDPMGVHTGDSITVAPAQTLTDKEYQLMRNASIQVLREIGVETGGSNVQFAVNPDDGQLLVIEMNPRVSRSSALASKATGFPIAKVATKLALGYTLDELANEITGGVIPTSFEPTIDYVVTKIPRFNFDKFAQSDDRLTTQMKAVGEVMAIGRCFQESLQKAIRGLETGVTGLNEKIDLQVEDVRTILHREISVPRPDRLWHVADAFRYQMSVEEVYELSHIDRWFLIQIEDLVKTEIELSDLAKKHNGQWDSLSQALDAEQLRCLKRKGFGDQRLAELLGVEEMQIREHRLALNIRPAYKRVDSCAAEFASQTAYLYATYEPFCEANPEDKPKIIILGSGPNRIAQGIEFDYCCVQAALALKTEFQTIMVNCNPETVSTDYDISDRLYFEPLCLESVLDIMELEKPTGVIVQYGGQTPLKLAKQLAAAGVPIIGTSPDAIDLSEDRERFQQVLNTLGLKQSPNCIARTLEQALEGVAEIGYPLMLRPSYVLGGQAMKIVYGEDELVRYIEKAVGASGDSVVLLDRFLHDAIEVDVDAVTDGKEVYIAGIMQHIEEAGVHSGDSACSLPPYSLSADIQYELVRQVKQIAKALGVRGLMNVQFAIQEDQVFVLETNPRASRTVPFISKSIGQPVASIAAHCMAGKTLAEQGVDCDNTQYIDEQRNGFAVKEAVFPFIKFIDVDPLLGPEMKSTGEVMGIGQSFGVAFSKAQIAAGQMIPEAGLVFISVKDKDKTEAVTLAQAMCDLGYTICATGGTSSHLKSAGIENQRVNKVRQGQPHIVDMIKNDEIAWIVNTTEGEQATRDSYSIRRNALQHKVFYNTTIAAAYATVEAVRQKSELSVCSLQQRYKNFLG